MTRPSQNISLTPSSISDECRGLLCSLEFLRTFRKSCPVIIRRSESFSLQSSPLLRELARWLCIPFVLCECTKRLEADLDRLPVREEECSNIGSPSWCRYRNQMSNKCWKQNQPYGWISGRMACTSYLKSGVNSPPLREQSSPCEFHGRKCWLMSADKTVSWSSEQLTPNNIYHSMSFEIYFN